MWGLIRRWRRRRWLREPLSATQREIVASYLRPYRDFRPETRQAIDDRVRILVPERHWEGCDGLRVDEEMRFAIAAQAAWMLLGTHGYFFDTIGSVLIFPDVIRRYEDGVRTEVVGEAWDVGNVVLSWPEVAWLRRDRDGTNVVIHEFAHHLDGLDGEMGGSLDFPDREDQRRWEAVASRDYQRLLADLDAGRPTLLDPYAATDRAEFFAVASETFFERPRAFRRHYRDLYDLLVRFYAIDPAEL